MLFKNIEMYNFGRYAGKNFFDTTVSSDRNVIIVRAMNDRGKTTLLHAIKFALYGDSGLGEKTASDWINLQRASEEDGEMYVEIKFEHEHEEYKLKRSIKYKKTDKGKEINTIGNSTLDLFKDDVPIMIEDSDSNKKKWIDVILPKDASQFFFFDGEEIQRYIRHEENHVRKAIEIVLGIKELLNSKQDLAEIYHRFQSEYNRNIKRQNKDEKVQTELDKTNSGISDTDQNIEIATQTLNGALRRKIELENELRKYQAIKTIVEERKDAQSKLKNFEKALSIAEKDLTANRSNLGLILSSSLLDIINQTEEDPPSMDRWQSTTIKYMLDKHLENCVCERPINDEILNMFKSKILDVKPSKTSILKKFVNHMLIDHIPSEKQVTLNTCLETVATHNQDIDKQKSTIESFNKQIRSIEGADSIKTLENKYEDVVKDIGKLELELKALNIQKEKLEKEKKKQEEKIEASVADEQLKAAKKRKDMCDMIMECIDQSIEKFYEKRKPKLEEYISKIFSSLTNNPDLYRGLKIDRNFSMKVLRNDGTELPTYTYNPSAGASQIVATSMIGGLNKFATKDAPIVIDTPMARLDPTHRKNLVNYYSNMGKQIIILYQPSELDDDDLQSIHDHLSSEWEISSVSDHPDMSKLNRTRLYL